jgi:hypothetical protein
MFNILYKYLNNDNKKFKIIDLMIFISYYIFIYLLDIPYLIIIISRYIVESRFNYDLFVVLFIKHLEINHYDSIEKRIIYDGENIYLNGYDLLKNIYKNINLNDYSYLFKESYIINPLIRIENKTLININGSRTFKHGLVRIYERNRLLSDLTITHRNPQIILKEENKTLYLHLSKNDDDCIINEIHGDKLVGNRVYNLLLVSKIIDNPNTMQFINSLKSKSYFEKIIAHNINLPDHNNFNEKFTTIRDKNKLNDEYLIKAIFGVNKQDFMCIDDNLFDN